MASHLYIPAEPVTLIRRILAHSLEVAVAGASASCGFVIVLIADRMAELNPTSSLAMLPLFLVYAIGGFLTAGGTLALWGLLVRKQNIRRELNVEQTGWMLLAAGWGAYMVAVTLLLTGTIIGMLLGLWITAGATGRYIALILLERRTVAAVEASETEGDGADHGA